MGISENTTLSSGGHKEIHLRLCPKYYCPCFSLHFMYTSKKCYMVNSLHGNATLFY